VLGTIGGEKADALLLKALGNDDEEWLKLPWSFLPGRGGGWKNIWINCFIILTGEFELFCQNHCNSLAC
jgi:hypothetical protein